MNSDEQQRRRNNVFDEAEDRLRDGRQQINTGASSGNFPPMQTSSFAAMFENHARASRNNSFEHDPAFGYDEHRVARGFKPQRDRSFSHEADEMASYGDGSFINEQEGFFQRNEDLALELELDFDELHDLVSELDKPDDAHTDKKEDEKTATSANFHVIINTQERGSSDRQIEAQNNNQVVDQEHDNVYANERDTSCCGTSQQHDYALDSTFQSVGFQDQLHDGDYSCDISLTGPPHQFNECSLDNMSLLDYVGCSSKIDHHMNSVVVEEEEAASPLMFINTCSDALTRPRRRMERAYSSSQDVPDKVVTDQDDAVFWGGPAAEEDEGAIARQLSILAPIRADAPPSDTRDSIMLEDSANTKETSSNGGITAKIRKLSQTIRGKQKKNETTQTPKKQSKSKKIAKVEKITVKEKLNVKSKQKAQAKKKPNIIKFSPNQQDVEEQKVVQGNGVDKNSRRPKKGDRTYYQNFDFFFKRTSFRTMTLFFKLAYKPFFDKWKANKKKYGVVDSLTIFVKKEFPGLFETLSEKARFEFIELVKLLVLSHRHNKNDDFLADPLIEFSIVREPMYKYSKQAQDRFFNQSTYTFLFAWFEASPEGRKFATAKFAENSDPLYSPRMISEVSQLGHEAQRILREVQLNCPADTGMARKSSQFLDQAASNIMACKLASYFEQARTSKWI